MSQANILLFFKLSTTLNRVSREIEALLQPGVQPVQEAEDSEKLDEAQQVEALEERIGQSWFAKLGIITLAIGIGFLLTIPYPSLPASLPSIIGFVIAVAIIVLAQRWHESFQHISGYLSGGGIVLLFFAILRLYFFSPTPVLDNRILVVVLLACAVCVGLYFSVKRQSVYLFAVSLTLGYITGLVGDDPLLLFISITILSALGVFYALRYTWRGLLVYVAGMNVLAHMLWFLNTPVLGREVHLAYSPQFNVLFVLVYMATIAAGTLWRKNQDKEGVAVVATSLINGLGGYVLILFLTLAQFKEHFVAFQIAAHCLLLFTATIFWVRERSKYSTFIYVMLGYMALSAAIIAEFPTPDYFIWLSWQSILVVSTAVWFRSRFIVVANFFIYLILFAAYLVLAGKIGVITLSFGVVALLSARILNAQKHRLELQTELMRNAYLASAFVVFPYALYHTVPEGLLSLSWLVVALFYYLMARAVKSSKYRWMALLTLLLTVIHVLAVDIVNLQAEYRVMSFIVLGVVLLAISLAYSRRKGRKIAATEVNRERTDHQTLSEPSTHLH